jgi:hypothetical protein
MFDDKFIDALATAMAPKIAVLIAEQLEKPKIAPRYLDLDQAATYMSTTKDSVRGMLRAKLFPAKKMGNRVYIDIREIDKAMETNTAWLQMAEAIETLEDVREKPERFPERVLDSTPEKLRQPD